jgi:hypothetical protein
MFLEGTQKQTYEKGIFIWDLERQNNCDLLETGNPIIIENKN